MIIHHTTTLSLELVHLQELDLSIREAALNPSALDATKTLLARVLNPGEPKITLMVCENLK